MLETFGENALSVNVNSDTRPEKMPQARILTKMMAIDAERAVTSMKAWAKFVQLASHTRSRPSDTLEEYLPSRIIDAGELLVY
jgi:hypothetical protein